jgi:hypothetical protein
MCREGDFMSKRKTYFSAARRQPKARLTFDQAKRQPWPSFDQAFSEFLPHSGS